jgi:hypothetical protein
MMLSTNGPWSPVRRGYVNPSVFVNVVTRQRMNVGEARHRPESLVEFSRSWAPVERVSGTEQIEDRVRRAAFEQVQVPEVDRLGVACVGRRHVSPRCRDVAPIGAASGGNTIMPWWI